MVHMRHRALPVREIAGFRQRAEDVVLQGADLGCCERDVVGLCRLSFTGGVGVETGEEMFPKIRDAEDGLDALWVLASATVESVLS